MMHNVVHKTLAIAAATLVVVGFNALSAQASPPGGGIDQASCQAQGGTYTFTKGVKTCTTTTVTPGGSFWYYVDGPTETTSTPFGNVSGHFQGETLYLKNITTTQTCTQRGNTKPTCTTSSSTKNIIYNQYCAFWYDTPQTTPDNTRTGQDEPNSECASRGLLPTS